jgi:hypothetical protein
MISMMISPRRIRRGNAFLSMFTAAIIAAPSCTEAASLTLAPNSGFGAPGEAIMLKGAGFSPNETMTVSIGGAPTSPATITANKSGAVEETFVLLAKPLPAGKHAVSLQGNTPHNFPALYTVRRTMTIDPPFGDGRPGRTWRSDKALPVGGSTGMVFIIDGYGFPAGAFVPADSIRVGKMPTVHEPLRIGPDGVLPATTIIVGSNLPAGRYDLVFKEGASTVNFSAIYQVAPWAATEALRERAASRSIDAARPEIRKVVAAGGDLLPPEEIAALNEDLKKAAAEVKAGNYETAEDLARGVVDKSAVLLEHAFDLRKDKMKGLAEVIASGFDTVQPEGAPAARQGAALVEKGRKRLAEAVDLVEKGDFDRAKAALKEANEILKKARDEAGVKTPEEPIRW